MAAQIIGEVKRTATEDFVVSISEYKGKIYLDARVWYKEDEDSTDRFPTQKGLSIPDLETADKLIALLTKGRAELAKKVGKPAKAKK